MDAHSPILLFDTGVGGLSVLQEVRAVLPDAPIIYAADMAGLPYGEKTEGEVTARVCGLLGRMSERYQPRLICIACNTASTIALHMVRDVLEVPIVGTVPAIKPAAALTKTGVIGLLGTAGTVRQPYVDKLEADFASDKVLLRHAAPELVECAETKLRGNALDRDAIRRAVDGLRDQPDGDRIDTVILACTHFPFLEEELSQSFGQGVQFVHGGTGIARRIATLTRGQEFDRITPDKAVHVGPESVLDGKTELLAQYGLDHCERF